MSLKGMMLSFALLASQFNGKGQMSLVRASIEGDLQLV